MKIYIEKDNKELSLKFEGTVQELLKKLKINPHTVTIIVNKKIESTEKKVKDSDKIELLEIVMGG